MNKANGVSVTIEHRTIHVTVDDRPIPIYTASIKDNSYGAFRDAMDLAEHYIEAHNLSTERNEK